MSDAASHSAAGSTPTAATAHRKVEVAELSLKILLLGDSAVGKTSLLQRFCDPSRVIKEGVFISTVGIDFKSKIIKVDEHLVKLQIWDTAGQERFRTISLSFLRGAQGVALVFDMGDRKSFEHVRDWHRQVQQQLPTAGSTDASGGGGCPMILVGNKADLEDVGKVAVSKDEASKVAAEMGIPLFFTSALTGKGVNEAFEELGTAAARRVFASRAPAATAGGSGGSAPASAGAGAAGGSAANPSIVNLREPADEEKAKANGCSC